MIGARAINNIAKEYWSHHVARRGSCAIYACGYPSYLIARQLSDKGEVKTAKTTCCHPKEKKNRV